MKDYILTKSFIKYLKISWRHKIIARWIFSTKSLKNLDRYNLYTLYHVKVHDIFKTSKYKLIDD